MPIIIATGIEKDSINFNKPEQKIFDKINMSGVREDYERGEFSLGSMGTKILAMIGFIEETGNEIIITLRETTMNALSGKRGIRVIKK